MSVEKVSKSNFEPLDGHSGPAEGLLARTALEGPIRANLRTNRVPQIQLPRPLYILFSMHLLPAWREISESIACVPV
jgi:hypothetical protein